MDKTKQQTVDNWESGFSNTNICKAKTPDLRISVKADPPQIIAEGEAGKHKQIIAEAGQARDKAAQLTATNRDYRKSAGLCGCSLYCTNVYYLSGENILSSDSV